MKRVFLLIQAAAMTIAANAADLSSSRIEIIDDIILKQFANVKAELMQMINGKKPWNKGNINKLLDDPKAKKKVYDAVEKKFPTPKVKVKGISPQTRKAIDAEIKRDFNWKTPEEVAAGAAKIAAAEVPLVKIGDEITVYYVKNGIYMHREGKVQSIRNNYRFIEIKGELIPVSGISRQDRIYFDPQLNEKAREQIRNYICNTKLDIIKKNASDRMISLELAKIKENERAGFIFYKNNWLTPKAVSDLIMKNYRQKTNKFLDRLKKQLDKNKKNSPGSAKKKK